ncbi:hypothetical protein ACQCSX_15665 [Pseudarthrobacter sp. P1]|uniref:COG4705 family protein n=1 Tax=Pseudarthrobacter sp. P1 TaxID=3418418 RepID=UPI003CF9EE1D
MTLPQHPSQSEERGDGPGPLAGGPAVALAAATLSGARSAWVKVPEVTALFWIIKVLTTGMGETTSDYLVKHFPPELAVAMGTVGLVVSLVLQFRTKRYVAAIYWLAVVMVSIFGTLAADVLHVGIGIPYIVSTGFFAVVLAAVLWLWHSTEKTLSIHSINTRRREVFYWLTVLTTFALGTAAGDLTAYTLGLGYLGSGIMFAAVFAIPALAYWRFGLNAIVAFWSAYIVTRPLGASFADWMAVESGRGGLEWGTGPVSLGLAAVILLLVAFLAFSRRDQQREP